MKKPEKLKRGFKATHYDVTGQMLEEMKKPAKHNDIKTEKHNDVKTERHNDRKTAKKKDSKPEKLKGHSIHRSTGGHNPRGFEISVQKRRGSSGANQRSWSG